MYEGWLSFGGTEIINAERVTEYVRKQLPAFPLKETVDTTDLHLSVGDSDGYSSPLVDDAPWLDGSNTATERFYGVYPLDISGDLDSTRTVAITQTIGDGGFADAARRATKEIRVKAVLVAADEMAMSAGFAWLSAALDDAGCGGDCEGSMLCFYAALPDWCDIIPPYNAGAQTAFGMVDVNTSPLVIDVSTQTTRGLARTGWNLPYVDGVDFQYGALPYGSSDPISISKVIHLQRTNYAPNPSFRNNVDHYTASGAGSFTREAFGGVDPDGSFGRMTSTSGTPSQLVLDRIDAFSGPMTMTLWARSPDANATISFTIESETSGELIGETTITIGSEWTEYSLSWPWGRDNRITISSNNSYDLDQILIEEGATTRGYFDGYSTAEPGYTVSWDAGGDNSISRIRYTDPLTTEQKLPWRAFLKLLTGSIPAGTLDIGYAFAEPEGTSVIPFERHMNDVVAIDGPTITGKSKLNAGLAWEVEFGFSAQTPGIFGTPTVALGDDWGDLPNSPFNDAGEITRRNLAQHPNSINTTGWTVANGVGGSVSAPTRTTTDLPPGDPTNSPSAYIRATWSVGASTAARLSYGGATELPVTGDLYYQFSAWQRYSGTGSMVQRILWYSALGVLQRADNIPVAGAPVTDFWVRYEFGAIAPTAAAYVIISITNADGVTATGSHVDMGGILLEQVDSENSPFRGYFDGDSVDTDAFTYAWSSLPGVGASTVTQSWMCATDEEASPLEDPDCPPTPAPPRPPIIIDDCLEDVSTWTRYYVEIPADMVPTWNSVVPTITYTTKTGDPIRQMRTRFYPNPFQYDFETLDPCSWCTEFILSFLPGSSSIIVDGQNKRATASVNGGNPLPADQLLYGTGGVPIEWPELSCGTPYLMTIDVPDTIDVNDLGVELLLTRKE